MRICYILLCSIETIAPRTDRLFKRGGERAGLCVQPICGRSPPCRLQRDAISICRRTSRSAEAPRRRESGARGESVGASHQCAFVWLLLRACQLVVQSDSPRRRYVALQTQSIAGPPLPPATTRLPPKNQRDNSADQLAIHLPGSLHVALSAHPLGAVPLSGRSPADPCSDGSGRFATANEREMQTARKNAVRSILCASFFVGRQRKKTSRGRGGVKSAKGERAEKCVVLGGTRCDLLV